MAVYDQRYASYDGPLTAQWSRFLVIPRHAYAHLLKSKMFVAFFAVCYVPILIGSIVVYLHHNASALAVLQLPVADIIPIDNEFFQFFVFFQASLAYLLALFVGPRLVARDVTDNALALYLARPFSRAEYVLGKVSVLAILTSLVTWVPLLLMFALQSYLEGFAWFAANLWLAWAIFVGSCAWILVISLLSQALSAWVKWATAARGAFVLLYLVGAVFGAAIDELFHTRLGGVVSLRSIIRTIWASLFRIPQDVELPVALAWALLAAFCGVCLLMLARKVRAYEVVR